MTNKLEKFYIEHLQPIEEAYDAFLAELSTINPTRFSSDDCCADSHYFRLPESFRNTLPEKYKSKIYALKTLFKDKKIKDLNNKGLKIYNNRPLSGGTIIDGWKIFEGMMSTIVICYNPLTRTFVMRYSYNEPSIIPHLILNHCIWSKNCLEKGRSISGSEPYPEPYDKEDEMINEAIELLKDLPENLYDWTDEQIDDFELQLKLSL